MHLKSSPKTTLQFHAFQTQELNPEKSPLSQLVLRLANHLTSNKNISQASTASQTQIRINQIAKQNKTIFLEHWNNQTKTQNKLTCYLALKREYKLAEYLVTVRDMKQRRLLTKYRLSDHNL
ncbi:hypothetical protein COCON_G00138560, partial [Conger conger]